jgi:uncharacterized protein YjbI with pentapeptide repeats
MKTNKRIKSDSVNLSSFFARIRKKVAKFTPQFMRLLGYRINKNKKMAGLPKIGEKIGSTIKVADISDGDKINLMIIDFKHASVDTKYFYLKKIKFTKCLFNKQDIQNVIFQECEFVDCQFNGANIKECEFHQCKFTECTFYKTQVSDTYLDPKSFNFSRKWYLKLANVNAWWFQELYRNSKNIHQEDFAMHADKKFQFYRRYEYLFGKNKKPHRFVGGLFYDIVLGYGYGIWNTLFFTFLLVIIFALAMQQYTNLGHNATFIESIYFSITSFSTVGYGEITPIRETIAHVITTAFLFLSVVWGAIVTAVIVKRLVK